jgi:hypothetical protein
VFKTPLAVWKVSGPRRRFANFFKLYDIAVWTLATIFV